MGLCRSWMFVPGHRQSMIDKALGLGVDAVMLDIEDGVAPAEKDTARRQIAASLARAGEAEGGGPRRGPRRYVRVNAVGHERMQADFALVVRAGLEGLVLPKVEGAEQVREVAELLDRAERERGIAPGSVAIMIAIESPKGLMNALAIATASPRVSGLMFGAEDFGKELGLPVNRVGEARELLHARSALVMAGVVARVQLIDGVWPDIKDPDGLERYALQARRLGFTGMSLIHPGQIDIINTVFSPGRDEVEYAQQVVRAFEEAQARGEGSIALGGQLIDLPIVERARHTLALAKALGTP